MKNTREQVPLDEADFYRALIRAVESGEPKVHEPETQPTREKPPMTVGAHKFRRQLKQIDH
jgi:hypothetical protein